MDATPINPEYQSVGGVRPPLLERSPFDRASASALSLKWSALHDAAVVVGGIAGQTAPVAPEVRNFPVAMRDTRGWRRQLIEQGVEDLTAIMEPGLSALLAAHARGADPVAAAQALWHEFHAARDALLALVPSPAR